MAGETAAATAPTRLGDEAFLRRASFDLIGRQPTLAEQQHLRPTHRPPAARAIERLLAGDEFGVNWANYWSDTIAYRVPPPELTYLNYGPLQELAGRQAQRQRAVGRGRPRADHRQGQDRREAAGDVRWLSPGGRHEPGRRDRAASSLASRLLCAQCHDHPFDHWKRDAVSRAGGVLRPHQEPSCRRTTAAARWSRRLDKGEYLMPDMGSAARKATRCSRRF